MKANFNFISFRLLTRLWCRTNVKSDNNSIWGFGKRNIRFVNSTYCWVNNIYTNPLNINLKKRCCQGFNWTLYVSLDNNINSFHFTSFKGIKEVIKTNTVCLLTLFHKSTFCTLFASSTSCLFIFINRKMVTSHWCFIQTSNWNWCWWSCSLNATTKVIGHSTNTSESVTNNDWILNIQSTLLYKKGSNRTFTFIQASFDNSADGSNCWISLKFFNFCDKKNSFK